MNQPDLFEARKLARRADPVTSHLAAIHVVESGTRAHQQSQTVAAVKMFPGRTSAELAEAAAFDRYALARRLPECERAGAVKRGEPKHCAITGRLALRWYPA